MNRRQLLFGVAAAAVAPPLMPKPTVQAGDVLTWDLAAPGETADTSIWLIHWGDGRPPTMATDL